MLIRIVTEYPMVIKSEDVHHIEKECVMTKHACIAVIFTMKNGDVHRDEFQTIEEFREFSDRYDLNLY